MLNPLLPADTTKIIFLFSFATFSKHFQSSNLEDPIDKLTSLIEFLAMCSTNSLNLHIFKAGNLYGAIKDFGASLAKILNTVVP